MAITSSYQIFNATPAKNAASRLNTVVTYLTNAKNSLLVAKTKCSYETFHTNEGNTFPSQIDGIVSTIDSIITTCNTLKNNIVNKADSIHNSDYASYQSYLQQQEQEAAE